MGANYTFWCPVSTGYECGDVDGGGGAFESEEFVHEGDDRFAEADDIGQKKAPVFFSIRNPWATASIW